MKQLMYTFAVATERLLFYELRVYVYRHVNLLVNYRGTVFIEFHSIDYLRNSVAFN